MSEYIRSIEIRAEIDTNKATYKLTTSSVTELVEWMQAHEAEVDLPPETFTPPPTEQPSLSSSGDSK